MSYMSSNKDLLNICKTDSPFTLSEKEEENGDRYSQRNAQHGRRQKAIKIIAVAI